MRLIVNDAETEMTNENNRIDLSLARLTEPHIRLGARLYERMVTVYATWGLPLPPGLVRSSHYGGVGFYVELDAHRYVANKDFLQHLPAHTPKTYFSGASLQNLPKGHYYLKDERSDDGKNISIHAKEDLPKLVPENHQVQAEVLPKLLLGRKFDIRVHVCACRDGRLWVTRNYLYRISDKKYIGGTELVGNLTNASLGFSNDSFYTDHHPDQLHEFGIDHDFYVNKIEGILPSIYNDILAVTNERDKITNTSELFYLHGLDFIFDDDDRPYLIEINSPPGNAPSLGMVNYHTIYSDAFKFVKSSSLNVLNC